MMKKNNKNLSPVVTESKAERMKMTAKLRKKRRRQRDALVSALLIITVICICIVLVYCTDMFTVNSVVINSDGERYQDTELINASGIAEGDRLFLINMKEAEKRITTSLPYVQTAKINRSIDGTVTFDLVYGKITYYITGVGGLVLLDSAGKVLENNASMTPDGIAEITGVTLVTATPGFTVEVVETEVFENTRQLAQLFSENEINNVTAYDFTDENDVEVEIDYRIVVKISSLEAVTGKLLFLREALKESLEAPPTGERVVFELTNDGAWSARGENSIEQAERLARERMTSTQPVTDEEGNTVEAQTTAAQQNSEEVAEPSSEQATQEETTQEQATHSETTAEPVFG